jgi:hypothetical protein
MDMTLEKIESELKYLQGMLVDIETPAARIIMDKDTLDTLRKGLTYKFKSLLAIKAKKVDTRYSINQTPQCNSTQDRQQLITTLYRENPSSSPDQAAQESPS